MNTSGQYFMVTIDSNQKIRQVAGEFHWNDEKHCYIINRYSGLYKGKITKQPEIIVERGKVNRTPTEQVNLQFDHIKKEYIDKGYKEIIKPANQYSESELKKLIGSNKTNKDGLLKPMLAKQADQISSSKTFDKEYYGSRKINGVRAFIYWDDKKNRIKTASRGAITYDIAISDIIINDRLNEWFKHHKNIILDGEIYKFGWTLNKISGICRTQSTTFDGKELEFYLYDIIDTNNIDASFNQRLEIINFISNELNLDFNPIKEWDEDDLRIQIVPQVPISGFDNMKALHDEYVKEGWEGLVVRLATAKYGPGKRTNDMIKIKKYKDSEYEIVGLSEGLRDEDLCFIMKTENGQEFKAKPIGNREQKQWYRDNIDNLIGKMGTLKYFEMSGKEGSEVPQQPIFLAVRDYE